MRKLIETHQEYLIVCDNNTSCDFKIKNPTGDINEDISGFLNMPCPQCGTNLLTQADYIASEKIRKVVNRINKWFSWTTIFMPKNKNDREVNTFVKVHNGVHILNENDAKNQH